MIHFCLSLLLSLWMVAVAILSVQNATAVTIQFFAWQSVDMPVGIVLAFSFALGVIMVALVRPIWLLTGSPDPPDGSNADFNSSSFGEIDNEDWL